MLNSEEIENNSIPFTPLFARVLLERQEVEKVGSIILPSAAQSKYTPAEGKIVAIGETVDDAIKPLIGRTVLFSKFAGDWLEIDKKKYFICQDEDILGVKE